MNKFLAACFIACGSQAVYSQPTVSDRAMSGFPAICYWGSGNPQGIDQSIVSGLYAEVRNQGQASFAPRLWLADPIAPPYEMSSVKGAWLLCQELFMPVSKPVGMPYRATQRPAWRAALLACSESTNDGRSACLKALFAEMEKRKYGLVGAPSLLAEGGTSYVMAPVVVPPPPPPQGPTSSPAATSPNQSGGVAK